MNVGVAAMLRVRNEQKLQQAIPALIALVGHSAEAAASKLQQSYVNGIDTGLYLTAFEMPNPQCVWEAVPGEQRLPYSERHQGRQLHQVWSSGMARLATRTYLQNKAPMPGCRRQMTAAQMAT